MTSIRLKIDDITNRILGYEFINENSTIFKNDIIFDNIDEYDLRTLSEKIKYAYYNPESHIFYISETIDEYATQLSSIRSTIHQLSGAINDPSNTIARLTIDKNITYEEAVKTVKENKAQCEQLIEKLNTLIEEHRQQIFDYWSDWHKKDEKDIVWKYYSSMCLLIRDENQYLEEWLNWHFNIGIDHIYIYDNGIKESVSDIVENLPEDKQEMITVVKWQGEFQDTQQDAYNDFLEKYGTETRWVNFLDSDEFVRITSDKYTNINEILKTLEDYTTVYGHIIEYNADGQETATDEAVRDRFTETTLVNEDVYHKDWIQTRRVDKMYIHYPQYSSRGNYNYKNAEKNQDLFIIDHYYTKSWEEWCVKIARGSATPVLLKSKNEFFLYNPDMLYLKGEDRKQGYMPNIIKSDVTESEII